MRQAFVEEFFSYDALKGGPQSMQQTVMAGLEQIGQDVGSFVENFAQKFAIQDRDFVQLLKFGIRHELTVGELVAIVTNASPLK